MRTAAQFVETVRAMLATERVWVLLYEVASIGGFSDPKKIWPEMRSPEFRVEVITQLPLGKFLPPDDLDEWVFKHPIVIVDTIKEQS